MTRERIDQMVDTISKNFKSFANPYDKEPFVYIEAETLMKIIYEYTKEQNNESDD